MLHIDTKSCKITDVSIVLTQPRGVCVRTIVFLNNFGDFGLNYFSSNVSRVIRRFYVKSHKINKISHEQQPQSLDIIHSSGSLWKYLTKRGVLSFNTSGSIGAVM